MSDSRLRELERVWRASGSDDDEAALLAERVRTGELVPDRLLLAAVFGHEPARLACQDDARIRGQGWRSMIFWRGDVETILRVAAATLKRLIQQVPCGPDGMLQGLVIEFAGHIRTGKLHKDDQWRKAVLIGQTAAMLGRGHQTGETIYGAIYLLMAVSYDILASWRVDADECFIGWLREARLNTGVSHLDDESLAPVIRADLVPWLLGYRDPLLDPLTRAG